MNEVIDIMVAQLASSIDEIDISEITEENYDAALEIVKNTLMTNPEWQNLDKNFANMFMDNDLSEEDGKALVQDMLDNLDASFDNLNYEGFKKDVLDFCRKMLKEKFTLFHETYGRTVIEFELINANAKIPSYAHPTDTGADVYAVEDTIIPAATCGVMVPLGFKMKLPAGWGIQVRPRSGLSAKQLFVLLMLLALSTINGVVKLVLLLIMLEMKIIQFMLATALRSLSLKE